MRHKKTLAIALAIAMVFGLVSMVAAAPAVHGTAFSDVPTDHARAKHITALGALGIALGESGLGGKFNPDSTMNRAEFATFAVRLANLQGSADALGNYEPIFNDGDAIPQWAWGYVNVAQSEGIVVGDDQGNFNAAQDVTYAEALTMLVRLTGWTDTVVGTNWPVNYLTRGIAMGLSTGVNLQASTPITRGDMAALLYNAGNQRRPEMDDGKWTGSLAPASTAPFASLSFTGALNYNPVAGTVDIGAELNKTLADSVYLSGFSSIEAAIGRNVRAFVHNGKVTGIEAVRAGSDVTGVYRDQIAGEGGQHIRLKDGTTVRLPADPTEVQATVNGGETKNWPGDVVADDALAITVENGVAVSVLATRYAAGDLVLDKDPVAKKASDVTSYNHVLFADEPSNKIRTDGAIITLNGEPATFDDLKKDDVVDLATVGAALRADGVAAYRIDATRNTVAIKSVDNTTISFEGTSYRITYKVVRQDDTKTDVKLAERFGTYALAAAVTAPASAGTYLLNADGEAVHFNPVGQPAQPAHAKLVMVGDTTPDPDVLPVFDIRGVMVASAGQVANAGAANGGNVGLLGTATYSGGKVLTWVALTDGDWAGGETHEVVAVDADNNSLTYKVTSGGTTTFHIINNPTVYKAADFATDNSVGAYLGLAKVSVGNKIKVNGNAVLVK